jgi:dienelactone hydrolase
VPFEPRVLSEHNRGSYVARKVAFNLTGDSRVTALMLSPKSPGPHPAVLLLHDHGAKFDIGKETVIQPWGEPPEKIDAARQWAGQYCGGRFIGDELARRGYVCLATDMLNWSDRGR